MLTGVKMRFSVMTKAAIGSVLYSMAAMGLIYYLSSDKAVTISNVAQDEVAYEGSARGRDSVSTEAVPGVGSVSDKEAEREIDTISAKALGTESDSGSGGENEGKPDTVSGGDLKEDEQVKQVNDGAQMTVTEELSGEGFQEAEGAGLIFDVENAGTSYMRVPLPEKCKVDDLAIENYYMNQELCILVRGAGPDFYAINAISGNLDSVEKGICEPYEGGVKLRFSVSGIFEYHTILENNDLYVSFLSPREIYDKIVVIDPSCGGSNKGNLSKNSNKENSNKENSDKESGETELAEKDINLRIAQKLKEKLDKTDIKVYYTRMDDANPAEEDRAGLANGTKADMYIRIQVDAKDDSSVYGATAVYNDDYFIPGFGNVELADVLEREVVTSIKGKALGLEPAGEQDYAIRNITIPAAAVKVGCITNRQEAGLLSREEYQDKIAEGICNAILKVYENID